MADILVERSQRWRSSGRCPAVASSVVLEWRLICEPLQDAREASAIAEGDRALAVGATTIWFLRLETWSVQRERMLEVRCNAASRGWRNRQNLPTKGI